MNSLSKMKLLPHEYFFGVFLLALSLRLVLAVGVLDHDALLYLGLLLGNCCAIACCLHRETKVRWQIRLWFYPVAMNIAFVTMGSAVMKVAPHRYDELLASIDHALFGMTFSARMQAITTPALTEVLSFCYLLFFPYLMFSWLYYAWRGLALLRKLFVGLFTIYGLGFSWLLAGSGGWTASRNAGRIHRVTCWLGGHQIQCPRRGTRQQRRGRVPQPALRGVRLPLVFRSPARALASSPLSSALRWPLAGDDLSALPLFCRCRLRFWSRGFRALARQSLGEIRRGQSSEASHHHCCNH